MDGVVATSAAATPTAVKDEPVDSQPADTAAAATAGVPAETATAATAETATAGAPAGPDSTEDGDGADGEAVDATEEGVYETELIDEYLVKWRGRAYIHCEWVDGDVIRAEGPQGKAKLQRYHNSTPIKLPFDPLHPDEVDLSDLVDPRYLEIDRIIAAENRPDDDGKLQRWYLVKWQQQPYSDATWEHESDINDPEQVFLFSCMLGVPVLSVYGSRSLLFSSAIRCHGSCERRDRTRISPSSPHPWSIAVTSYVTTRYHFHFW